MRPGNDRWRRSGLAIQALLLGAAALLPASCGGPDRASVSRDVRLEVSHDPPGSGPPGEPVLLDVRLSSNPPLPPGSAHLWYASDGEWLRQALTPLAGTDRFEAQLPPQPRGRQIRYYFTVRSPLGETVRLPEDGTQADGGARGRTTYTLHVRAPVAPWAAWLRGLGAAVALGLVLLGGWLTLRRRATTPEAAPRFASALGAAGVVLFAAALVGAAAASLQATGDPLREVPGAWWIGLLLWLPLPLLARAARRKPAAGGRRRALTLVVPLLATAGALAVLAGLARLV